MIVISNSDKKFRAMMEGKEEDQLMMKTCFEKKLPLQLLKVPKLMGLSKKTCKECNLQNMFEIPLESQNCPINA